MEFGSQNKLVCVFLPAYIHSRSSKKFSNSVSKVQTAFCLPLGSFGSSLFSPLVGPPTRATGPRPPRLGSPCRPCSDRASVSCRGCRAVRALIPSRYKQISQRSPSGRSGQKVDLPVLLVSLQCFQFSVHGPGIS